MGNLRLSLVTGLAALAISGCPQAPNQNISLVVSKEEGVGNYMLCTSSYPPTFNKKKTCFLISEGRSYSAPSRYKGIDVHSCIETPYLRKRDALLTFSADSIKPIPCPQSPQ